MKKIFVLLVLFFKLNINAFEFSNFTLVDSNWFSSFSYDKSLSIYEDNDKTGQIDITWKPAKRNYQLVLKDDQGQVLATAKAFQSKDTRVLYFKIFDQEGDCLGIIENYDFKEVVLGISYAALLYSKDGSPLLSSVYKLWRTDTPRWEDQNFYIPGTEEKVVTLPFTSAVISKDSYYAMITNWEYLNEMNIDVRAYLLFFAIRSQTYYYDYYSFVRLLPNY
jgi:hypothetical protein